ncbi:hypothetical protein SuNHUV7_20140 (plasmid) [Pseudoseohaeicola sp. NH-UV-7]
MCLQEIAEAQGDTAAYIAQYSKHDLARPDKGTDGDAIFAVLCGCDHNIRMIFRHLRLNICQLIWLRTRLRQGVSVEIAPARMNQTVRMAA